MDFLIRIKALFFGFSFTTSNLSEGKKDKLNHEIKECKAESFNAITMK